MTPTKAERKAVMVRVPLDLLETLDSEKPDDLSRNTWLLRLLRQGLAVERSVHGPTNWERTALHAGLNTLPDDDPFDDPLPAPVLPLKPLPSNPKPEAPPKPRVKQPQRPRHGVTCGCPVCKG